MFLIDCHNRCPDCLHLDFRICPEVESGNDNILGLFITWKTGEQKQDILDGTGKFRIRNCQLLIEGDNLKFFPLYRQTVQGKKGAYCLLQLENNPQFEGKIGLLEIQNKPWRFTAKVVTEKSEILFTEIDGFWKHDISPNKHAILERLLAEFLFETGLKPYVCCFIFASDGGLTDRKIARGEVEELERKKEELKNIIQRVVCRRDDNFKNLAEIAKLNPARDFRGGNLIGVNLSGLNLSGGDFQYANLRGADLTDTDLSEANLQYAKLNGADLSGAYLEGANLSNANLTNASLALANLIGANLSNANLTNTNLQNTTLAQAIVKGAIFANNPGLTPEKKEELMAGGAIFV
ncbi:MAG: pentapeptide repeat-containing protein [Geminocystis sp.]|nr:pentapeptide repeat-containing protein [Geminocystis sp.]HIK37124.1 pentapeptide repeat-containing protein [Geminocystis sp. M7585_C2015_104]MCS7147507.1 pentapeptide repeat-containing protein [Geminocystis sp.]MCX8077910.1 pentapeptide repeat-containing protein [Geminocystis sp.]MDW8115200.1 pentapeptide repeat-containing protein [Geminocystis sp.]